MQNARKTGSFSRFCAIFFALRRQNANTAPTRPNITPSTASFTSSAASHSAGAETANSNFSSPSAPETALAQSAAAAAGSSARCSSLPTVSTSMAKAVAANGVRNSPAKPADMPVISIRRGASSTCSSLPTRCDIAAPSCTATPSLPALPPKRCVSQVAHMTKGTRRSGISSLFACPASNTMPMPFSQPAPNLR